jgi:hypothetical protein
MELNRAVCLDLPGANVPWFHKKFCEELITISGKPTKSYCQIIEIMYIYDHLLSFQAMYKTTTSN